MPITGEGWELLITRNVEQRNPNSGKRRTVGDYQVFVDGAKQSGLNGRVAECGGPGANAPAENGRRVEPGRYPLFTQDGTRYVTIGYAESQSSTVLPKPGLELKQTGKRSEILIHPGRGFLSSIGCINPCTSLPDASEMIDFPGSRRRVIDLIEHLKRSLGGDFPGRNGRGIPRAFAVIEGEPASAALR